jgi:glycerol-3-phosphate dehydrogenase (NAD(P)+)
MQAKIAILGAGNMGSALAKVLGENGRQVHLWDHFADVTREIRVTRRNSRFLPGVLLPGTVEASEAASEAVAGAGFLIIAVPSAFASLILKQVAHEIGPGTVLVNVAKGIDPGTGLPAGEAIARQFPANQVVSIAGPAIANEFARGRPTATLFAGRHRGAAEGAAQLFANDYFKATISDDVAGACWGGILKNVYAILLGYVETAFQGGRNLEAAVLSASVEEMRRLGTAWGGRPETFHGLAGLGDLAATGLSHDSHNRRCGSLLGEGKSLAEVEEAMGRLPEGVRTVELVCARAEPRGIKAALASHVRAIMAGQGGGIEALFRAL